MTDRQIRKQGKDAELFVSQYLRYLGKEYMVFDNVLLPTNKFGGTTQIDHVVVSPYGIFVVETKSHKGKIFGSLDSKYWTQTLLTRQGLKKHQFYNPVMQNAAHIKALSKLLDIPYSYFCGVVVFANPNADITSVVCGNICTPYTLGLLIHSYKSRILSSYQLGCIIQKLQEGNMQSAYRDRKHIKYVKSLQKG